ncbi:MAG: ABC transporter permease, partial [Planctomycetaceae bacterium]
MMKALLWKEWHEQRWRVALATVWLLGMTAIGLKSRIEPDITILIVIWIPTATLLPTFAGMGVFASERKAGTLPYLMAQPINRSQILAAKVIAGLSAYLIPIVTCGIVICLAVGGREVSSASLVRGLIGIAAFGTVLFAWQLLMGLRCRREETYVLVSLMVLVCCIVHWLIMNDVRFGDLLLEAQLWAVNPFSIIGLATD